MIILIFNELYAPYKMGGAEVSTQLLAEHLVKLGIEVHVCTSGIQKESYVLNGVIVHRISQSNVYWSYEKDKQSTPRKALWHIKECYNINCKKDILEVIGQVHPNIIHTNVIAGFSVIIWEIAHKLSIPIVHTLRDYYLMCYKSTLYNKQRCDNQCLICKFFSKLKREKSKYVHAVVGISKFILDKHLNSEYFQNSTIQMVIPNSVDIMTSRQERHTNKCIGYLGRLHESKGVEYLIKTFIEQDTNGYHLKIAGDGDSKYITYLKAKYKTPSVQFVGRVNAENFLKQIDLLVVPSLWEEPFGRVVIEANACGCPVLVSNRGGLVELIDGNNGAVFSLEKKGNLGYMLNKFFNNNITFNITDKLMCNYSPGIIAERYSKIYKYLKLCYFK